MISYGLMGSAKILWFDSEKKMALFRHIISTKSCLKLALLLNILLFCIGLVRMVYLSGGSYYSPTSSISNPASRNLMSQDGCVCSERPQAGESEPRPAPKHYDHYPALIGQDVGKSAVYQVPNIVHYIWYNQKSVPLQWHQMLSILSAHKLINPDVLYFHTDREPTGPHWERIRSLPKLKVLHRDPPYELFGETVKKPLFYTSHSNVDRVSVLMEYGGIYLDFDVLVTKPFDELRKYPCTIGLERETQACGSVIVCSKDAFFLRLWINSYLDDYRIEEWAYNTGKVPFNLWKRFPELVHVEKTRLNRPNFKELDKIYGSKTWDWQNNYAVHLWYRLWKEKSHLFQGVEPNDDNIKTWNTTFGQMARAVLFGSSDKIVG